jgi:hypothetical protein
MHKIRFQFLQIFVRLKWFAEIAKIPGKHGSFVEPGPNRGLGGAFLPYDT